MRFCIVGSGRCGTSLLRGLMNRHPQVWVHGETHWLPRMYEYAGLAQCRTEALVHILRNTTHTEGTRVTPVDDAELERLFGADRWITVRAFADRIGEVLAAREGKTIWADKTPDYGFFMQQIQALWPDCRFVHLIRNGLDVAVSMSHHPGFQWIVTAGEATWCSAAFNGYFEAVEARPQPLTAYAARWHHAVTRIRDEATRLRPGSYREIRYEDILADPGTALVELADFIGLEPDPDWIAAGAGRVDPGREGRQRDPDLAARLDPAETALLRALGYL